VGENIKNRLSKYTEVVEYNGTCNGTTIYKIREDNTNIRIDLDALLQEIANSDVEADPMEMKSQAYILCSTIHICNEEHNVKLISMNSPITILKNKFFQNKGKFFEISPKVLNLRTIINVIIYDKTVYFMDMSGETLFNMERAYKIKCNVAVNEIEKLNIISDGEVFEKFATSGQNPRRFVAFSESKLNLLTKKKNREKVSNSYSIPLTMDKKYFDTSNKKNVDNLVKVLCGKAMWDILEEIPVEVENTRTWAR
jgi:hypothetical protein